MGRIVDNPTILAVVDPGAGRDCVMTGSRPLLALLAWALAIPGFADGDVDDESEQPPAIMSSLLSMLRTAASGEEDGLNAVLFGDVDGDSQTDAVVMYSHGVGNSGGNSYSQRMALFLDQGGRWVLVQHTKVGSKGKRFLTPVSMEPGIVVFDVVSWSDDDPMCCPSRASQVQFRFADGKLSET